MLQRLSSNFYLAMITLVGLIFSLAVTPYALYRWFTGNYFVAIVDLLMVCAAIISVVYAWRTGDTDRPGLVLGIFFCIGATLVSINLGVNGVFWIYPLLVFIFFLAKPQPAVMLSMAMLLTLLFTDLWQPGRVFADRFQLTAFMVTAFVASFFAFMFAHRTLIQHQALKQLASIDSLTGAGNRHTLNAELEVAVQLQQKTTTSFGIMLLDLDYFKAINDNYGHRTGDDILKRLVPIVESNIRHSDRVFRYGGEEFLVLLKDLPQQELADISEKIRQRVEQHLILPDGKNVTLSAGVTMLKANETWEQWLHRADLALYQAKHSGRNQVVTA